MTLSYRAALLCRVPVVFAFRIVNRFGWGKKGIIHKPEYVFICNAFDPREFYRIHNMYSEHTHTQNRKKGRKKQLLSVYFNSNNCNKRSIRNIMKFARCFFFSCLFHPSFISIAKVPEKKISSYNVLEYSNKNKKLSCIP